MGLDVGLDDDRSVDISGHEFLVAHNGGLLSGLLGGFLRRLLGGRFFGSGGLGGGLFGRGLGRGLLAAGGEREDHHESQEQSKDLFHFFISS